MSIVVAAAQIADRLSKSSHFQFDNISLAALDHLIAIFIQKVLTDEVFIAQPYVPLPCRYNVRGTLAVTFQDIFHVIKERHVTGSCPAASGQIATTFLLNKESRLQYRLCLQQIHDYPESVLVIRTAANPVPKPIHGIHNISLDHHLAFTRGMYLVKMCGHAGIPVSQAFGNKHIANRICLDIKVQACQMTEHEGLDTILHA